MERPEAYENETGVDRHVRGNNVEGLEDDLRHAVVQSRLPRRHSSWDRSVSSLPDRDERREEGIHQGVLDQRVRMLTNYKASKHSKHSRLRLHRRVAEDVNLRRWCPPCLPRHLQ